MRTSISAIIFVCVIKTIPIIEEMQATTDPKKERMNKKSIQYLSSKEVSTSILDSTKVTINVSYTGLCVASVS